MSWDLFCVSHFGFGWTHSTFTIFISQENTLKISIIFLVSQKTSYRLYKYFIKLLLYLAFELLL